MPSALRLAICLTALLPITAQHMPVGFGMAHATETRIDWKSTPLRLLMVERGDCIYCRAWHAQIGPGYAGSAAGKAAPLLTVDMDGAWPDGLVLARRPFITPTFILLDEGVEVARVEGYFVQERFYPAINNLLATTVIKAATKKGHGE